VTLNFHDKIADMTSSELDESFTEFHVNLTLL